MDEKVKEIERQSKQGPYLFNPPAQLFQMNQDIKYLLSHISSLSDKFREAQDIIGQLQIEKQIFERASQDGDERIDELKERIKSLEQKLREAEEENHSITDAYLQFVEMKQGLEFRIKSLEDGIEKHKQTHYWHDEPGDLGYEKYDEELYNLGNKKRASPKGGVGKEKRKRPAL